MSERSARVPNIPELAADYEILGELGRGGTAVVYRARERLLGREVAIKVIRSTYVEQEEAAARLLREAQTIGGLQHPNIVVLYGTRRLADGSIALIMQLVPGRTLKQEIAHFGPLPHGRVTRTLMDIARALEYAHRRRIVHRDIKPENIYIHDQTGSARLADFGAARPWDEESGLTLPGTAIGTPAYMSPEQIDGGKLDGRSDVFSLGAVGYEMLTGRRPWAGESLFNVIYKQKHEELPPLEAVRPDVPRQLLEAVNRALAKDPDGRWPGAAEFLAALAASPAAPAPPPQAGGKAGGVAAAGGRAAVAMPHSDDDGVTIIYRRDAVIPSAADLAPTATGAAPAETGAPATEPVTPVAPAGAPAPERGVEPAAMPSLAAVSRQVRGGGAEEKAGQGDAAVRPRRRLVMLVAALLVTVVAGVAAGVRPWMEPETGSPDVAAGAGSGMEAIARSARMQLYQVVGSYQHALVGDTLPAPLMVRVDGLDGEPLAGVTVAFTVVEGEGEVQPAEAVTDERGLVSVQWILAEPGSHRVEAAVVDEGLATSFIASAFLPRAVRLASRSPDRLPAGDAAGTPLLVVAEDARGRPVAGELVRFRVTAGGGAVNTQVAVTDSTGMARVSWTYGNAGAQQAAAALQGVDAPEVVFRGPDRVPAVAAAQTAPSQPDSERSAPAPVATGAAAWARLAPGGTHGCGLGGDGSLSCWGGNESGQLGDGSQARRGTPVRATVPEPLAGLAAGVSHTCGVGRTGRVYCWGANASGQLGDGSMTSRTTPVEVATGEPITAVGAGRSHTCALAASGALYCWGDNSNGQLGVGSRTNWSEPVRAGGNLRFRSIAAGWTHTCGIATDGAAWCWGRNADGQLGDGSSADRATPVAVSGGHRFSALAAGSAHTCGVAAAGTLLCWGQNTSGQLGTGTEAGTATPAAVRTEERFAAVAAGGVHSCGLTTTGFALCWGRNTYGQLGDGTTEDRLLPVPVAGGMRFTALALSGAHSCGSAAAGGWMCWGYNVEGQLGDGTRTNQALPVPVARR